VELASRTTGDELLRPGELLRLRQRLRQIARRHDLTSVITCAFDHRTRMLPFVYAARRMAPAGVRAIGSAMVDCGFDKTRIVLQQWNRNFRPSQMRLDGRVPDVFLLSSMSLHMAPCLELIRDACRIDRPHRPLIIVGVLLSGMGISETGGTSQVATAGDLDNTDTGMLLVLRAQAAIVRAALLDGGGKVIGNGPRLVVFERVQVPVGVRGDQRLVPAVLRAVLAHNDGPVADEHLGVYDLATFRAQAARDFVKDVVTNRLLDRGNQLLLHFSLSHRIRRARPRTIRPDVPLNSCSTRMAAATCQLAVE